MKSEIHVFEHPYAYRETCRSGCDPYIYSGSQHVYAILIWCFINTSVSAALYSQDFWPGPPYPYRKKRLRHWGKIWDHPSHSSLHKAHTCSKTINGSRTVISGMFCLHIQVPFPCLSVSLQLVIIRWRVIRKRLAILMRCDFLVLQNGK